jgi:hypothetical protein
MTDNTTPLRGAQGASGKTPEHEGDFEAITEVLRTRPGSDANRLAVLLSDQLGPQWDKKRVNSVIYRMENAGLVSKELVGSKPLWSLR